MNPYLAALRYRNGRTPENFALAEAWSDAVSLAFEERVGREMQPGQMYSIEDAERADKIMQFYPQGGA
jgi:hypothetical protein